MKKFLILLIVLSVGQTTNAQWCRPYTLPIINQWYVPPVCIQPAPVIIVPPRVTTVFVYINGAGGNWIDQYTSLWYVNAYYPAWQIAARQRNSSVVTWACWTQPVKIQPRVAIVPSVSVPTNPFLLHQK